MAHASLVAMPDFSLEDAAHGIVAGIDEVGRGPWAGPVVAAAVVLDRRRLPPDLRARIDDSKRLAAAERARILALLADCAAIGLGAASNAEIDQHNILGATFLAMRRALAALGTMPAVVLVDGNRAPPLPCRVRTIVGGDRLSLSIAAASIAAKVTRDRLMARLARRYPGYGWDTNAGYGTPGHRAGLAAHGVSAHHRRSFAPINKMLSPAPEATPTY